MLCYVMYVCVNVCMYVCRGILVRYIGEVTIAPAYNPWRILQT